MAYGILIQGVGGIFQVDSEKGSTKYMQVTHNSTTSNSQSGLTGHRMIINHWKSGDIVFARPVSGSGRLVSYFQVDPPEFEVSTAYLVLKPANSTTASTSLNGSNYGIQINGTTTGTKLFDSRGFASGVAIEEMHPKSTLFGGDQPLSSAFGGTGNLEPSNRTILTTTSANWSKAYVTVNNGYYSQPDNANAGVVQNGYHFDSSNYRILYQGYLQSSATEIGNVPLTNSSTIMAGLLQA